MAAKGKQVFAGLMLKTGSFFSRQMAIARNFTAHNGKRVLSGVISAAVALSMIPILCSPVQAADSAYWTDAGNYDTYWFDYNPSASSYTIHSAAELAGLVELNNYEGIDFANKTITLTSSLDLSAHLWDPIGTAMYPFRGTFDGGRYSMATITTTDNSSSYQGLFGVNAGRIKNVNAVGASIIGGFYSGIIAGMNNGNIVNCSASGTITGSGAGTGGITGRNNNNIADCINSADTAGQTYIGGIAGYNYGTVGASYNTGSVVGAYYIGGIAGQNSQYISGAYSVGALSGLDYVGGIAGVNNGGTIANTYYSGAAAGIGGDGATTGTTPFIRLSNSTISSSASTQILELTSFPDMNLGAGFSVSYCSFTSSVPGTASVSGTTVQGLAGGSTDITGAMTITQNGLTSSGFTDSVMQIYVPVSMPLTVAKAQPTLTTPIADPSSPSSYPTSIDLSSTISNFSGTLSGQTIGFYNGNTLLGYALTNAGGTAVYTWANPTVSNYSITARFSEDSNNLSAVSGSLSYTVIKGTQASFSITGLPASNTVVYGDLSFDLSTQGGSGNGTVAFSSDNNSVLKVDVNGAVTITGAGEATITAKKAGDANYNEISATQLITVSQKQLSVSVDPVTINCGQAIPSLTVQVIGFVSGENAGNLTGFTKPSADNNYGITTTPVSGGSLAVTYTGGTATDNYYFAYNDTALITINAVYATSGDYLVTVTASTSSGPAGWNTSDLIITPTGGGTQISTDRTMWSYSLAVSSEGENNSITFYLRQSDGTQTESTTLYYNLDMTAPTGRITIKNNAFSSFVNNITFGLFFKESIDVTIEGSDSVSGVAKIEYQKVANEAGFSFGGAWTTGSTFTVNPDQKFIVYARITDQAGNATVINSNGVVIYTDSALSAASAVFDLNMAKPGYRDIQVTHTPADNTLKDITLGGTSLVPDTDYTVAGSVITIKKEFLKTVVSGTVTLIFSFNPLGERYVRGDVPVTASFAITEIKHAAVPSFIKNLSGEATYAKDAAASALDGTASVTDAGTVTYQWYVKHEADLVGTAIEGATSASYTPKTESTGVHEYYVVARNTNLSVNGETTATAVSGTCKVIVNSQSVLPAVVSSGAPATTLPGTEASIFSAVLTGDDNARLAGGSNISIYVKTEVFTPSQADKAAVQAVLGENALVEYLNISLIKNIDGVETNVTSLNSPIRITIVIPETARQSGRVYSIVRVHNGITQYLPDLDSDPTTYTFETDVFSTYAFLYRNAAPTPTPTPTAASTPTPTPTQTSAPTATPTPTSAAAAKTGETSSILPVIVLIAGVITLTFFIRKRREV
ncbi:MAG: X2-like carbohydrate binding domain-containing protein [Eubacteriales bacterium]